MATGNTQVGYGAILTWNAIPVAKITKIGAFGYKVDTFKVSTFDAASRSKQTRAGLVDSEEITFEGVLATDDTTAQMALLTDGKAATSRAFIITMPTTLGTATFTGTGFLSEIEIGDITPEAVIPIKGKICPTSIPAWSSAA